MTLLQRNNQVTHFATQAQEIYDVTGAGDTVIAVLTASVAAGSSLVEAVKLANTAAGIVVGKLGAVAIDSQTLGIALHSGDANKKILSKDELLQTIAKAKTDGETIVMTNGCFDILHAGHVHYLKQAKALGTKLIMAVNDDASVQRLKGETRPIHALEARMSVLAELHCVDWLVSFSTDTPEQLISEVLPDVLVKGGDYTVEQIAGAKAVMANGGRVEILPFLPGFSTTNIVEKVSS